MSSFPRKLSVPDLPMAKRYRYRHYLAIGMGAWLLLCIPWVPCGAASLLVSDHPPELRRLPPPATDPSPKLHRSTLPVAASSAAWQHLTRLDRHYDLSFLWFERLAVGKLSFSRDPASPKRYRALLEAKTLGVAAWLTGDKVQRYETLMELTPQGRLQPLEYTAIMQKKSGNEVIDKAKLYKFNAVTRTITLTRSKDGKKGIEQPIKIAGKLFPVDFLTAGFNFISGADGPIRIGERKEIVTFTDEGKQKIIIEVLRPEDWPKTPFFRQGSGTLLKVILPAEILDTDGGAVYALLDNELLPQRVIVEKVLGLGEVRGKVRP